MIRLYMVHHRLPNMQVAVAKMVEAVTKTEGPYRYQAPHQLSRNGEGGAQGRVDLVGAQVEQARRGRVATTP